MKYLIKIAIILNLIGCTSTPSKLDLNSFVVKNNSSKYGMKYHFVLETTNKISDMHNPISKFILITHYHIYTNSLGKVSGDKILFSKHDNIQPKQLSKNSTFTFNSKTVMIEGLKWCSDVMPHCENTLNGKYPIQEYSKLQSESEGKDNRYKGHYK